MGVVYGSRNGTLEYVEPAFEDAVSCAMRASQVRTTCDEMIESMLRDMRDVSVDATFIRGTLSAIAEDTIDRHVRRLRENSMQKTNEIDAGIRNMLASVRNGINSAAAAMITQHNLRSEKLSAKYGFGVRQSLHAN